MNFQECELGFTFQHDTVCVFFGKFNCDFEGLQKRFKHFEFYQIKQTHSDIVVEASSNLKEADAHWTQQKQKALLIRTADCIPAMIFNSKTKTIAAVHAGWRGVANQITRKTLMALTEREPGDGPFDIWFGPHIQKESFEVGDDVFAELLEASYGCSQADIATASGPKLNVDIQKIVRSQIDSLGLKINIFKLPYDTKSDRRFHSFRRDGNSSGRSLSFICLI